MATLGFLKHVWTSHHIALNTKTALLRSCIVSVLLFGSESWTLRAHHMRWLSWAWGLSWQHQHDDHLSAANFNMPPAGLAMGENVFGFGFGS